MRARRPLLVASALALAVPFLWPERAEGTIEDQRARLPPPADCADPVEGEWVGLKFFDTRHQWNEFSLTIKRKAKDSPEIEGQIQTHYWFGGPLDSKPPPCKPGGLEVIGKMPASGKVETSPKGLTLVFAAKSYTKESTPCGIERRAYNPDKLTGTIDPALQEFQSVNNDGGIAVNDPYVFRRVKCFDSPPPPKAEEAPKPVEPPPLPPPPAASRGCGCGIFG
jgi:hypothetical protein